MFAGACGIALAEIDHITTSDITQTMEAPLFASAFEEKLVPIVVNFLEIPKTALYIPHWHCQKRAVSFRLMAKTAVNGYYLFAC